MKFETKFDYPVQKCVSVHFEHEQYKDTSKIFFYNDVWAIQESINNEKEKIREQYYKWLKIRNGSKGAFSLTTNLNKPTDDFVQISILDEAFQYEDTEIVCVETTCPKDYDNIENLQKVIEEAEKNLLNRYYNWVKDFDPIEDLDLRIFGPAKCPVTTCKWIGEGEGKERCPKCNAYLQSDK